MEFESGYVPSKRKIMSGGTQISFEYVDADEWQTLVERVNKIRASTSNGMDQFWQKIMSNNKELHGWIGFDQCDFSRILVFFREMERDGERRDRAPTELRKRAHWEEGAEVKCRCNC